MDVISIRTPSLGDATYIVAHGSTGIIIEPQRDLVHGDADRHGRIGSREKLLAPLRRALFGRRGRSDAEPVRHVDDL